VQSSAQLIYITICSCCRSERAWSERARQQTNLYVYVYVYIYKADEISIVSAYFGLPQCTAFGPAGYSCLINRHKANRQCANVFMYHLSSVSLVHVLATRQRAVSFEGSDLIVLLKYAYMRWVSRLYAYNIVFLVSICVFLDILCIFCDIK
jgi:hypothetical protein